MRHIKLIEAVAGKRFKIKLAVFVLIGMVVAILDVIGLSLANELIASTQFPAESDTLKTIKLLIFSFSMNSAIALVILTLSLKSIVAALLNYAIYSAIAKEQSRITNRVFLANIGKYNQHSKKKTLDSLVDGLSMGMNYAIVDYLSSSLVAIVEFIFISIICIYLFILNPQLFFILFSFFILVAVLQVKYVGKMAQDIGLRIEKYSIEVRRDLVDSFNLSQELKLSGLLKSRVQSIYPKLIILSRSYALKTVAQNVPKYIYELLSIGVLILIYITIDSTDFNLEFFGDLGIYAFAFSRLFPSLLRFQSALLVMRSSSGQGSNSFDLIEAESTSSENPIVNQSKLWNEKRVTPLREFDELKISDLSFRYSQGDFKLSIKNLVFRQGEFIAIMGETGSGKTTLGELMLGGIEPDEGSVTINGVLIDKWIGENPGALGYVPQSVFLTNDSLSYNVSLKRDLSDGEVIRIDNLLARLGITLDSDKNSLGDTDRKAQQQSAIDYSGGQSQRIGVARALFSTPRVIVIDEGTSSQDAFSETKILEYLSKEIKQRITIFIAHRPEVLNYCGRVIHLQSGEIIFDGSPSEYLENFPK
jgi:ABC-type multidrug transport system fused ATPase/permease subunit